MCVPYTDSICQCHLDLQAWKNMHAVISTKRYFTLCFPRSHLGENNSNWKHSRTDHLKLNVDWKFSRGHASDPLATAHMPSFMHLGTVTTCQLSVMLWLCDCLSLLLPYSMGHGITSFPVWSWWFIYESIKTKNVRAYELYMPRLWWGYSYQCSCVHFPFFLKFIQISKNGGFKPRITRQFYAQVPPDCTIDV